VITCRQINNIYDKIEIDIKIYRIINFLVGLHGCETWFLNLREVYGLKTSENTVLKRKIGCEMT
jgi:hypothetical protein